MPSQWDDSDVWVPKWANPISYDFAEDLGRRVLTRTHRALIWNQGVCVLNVRASEKISPYCNNYLDFLVSQLKARENLRSKSSELLYYRLKDFIDYEAAYLSWAHKPESFAKISDNSIALYQVATITDPARIAETRALWDSLRKSSQVEDLAQCRQCGSSDVEGKRVAKIKWCYDVRTCRACGYIWESLAGPKSSRRAKADTPPAPSGTPHPVP